MEQKAFTPADHNTSARTAAYLRALEACSAVASKETDIASSALDEVQALTRNLHHKLKALSNSIPGDAGSVEDARMCLQEIETKLDISLNSALDDIRAGLSKKRTSLNQFTVTLFGRTMAGKSTIREALTQGDGSTIGAGAQRTTRDVREYSWNALRIIDTPGIGAYEGEEDRNRAVAVLDETDIVIFLISSDSIQEEAFKGMATLRDQNKPVLFVLNVKRDLQKPVYMRRFLADPDSIFNESELTGHRIRIRQLAGEHLGMREVRIVPIHAQAAYLSTRPEYQENASALSHGSRLEDLLGVLETEVLERGAVRRLQTILDGTIVHLLALQQTFQDHATELNAMAKQTKNKFKELDVWLDAFIVSTNVNIHADVTRKLMPLRNTISTFIEDNIEKSDVTERWQQQVNGMNIEQWLSSQQRLIMDELRGKLASFAEEISVESHLLAKFESRGPSTYNPMDVKRNLKRVSAASAAVASVASVAGILITSNFWNPIGWIAGAVGIVAWGLSFFFENRQKKLQKRKAQAADELRGSVDLLEKEVARELKRWFYEAITKRMVRGVRKDTRRLYDGMFAMAHELKAGSQAIGHIVETLNRRLLARAGQFSGARLPESQLGSIVREPGFHAKFLWKSKARDQRFCEQVSKALGETIVGIAQGTPEQMIATALRPAQVPVNAVILNGKTATVLLPKRQVGQAIGKAGSNQRMAGKLLGFRILIEED